IVGVALGCVGGQAVELLLGRLVFVPNFLLHHPSFSGRPTALPSSKISESWVSTRIATSLRIQRPGCSCRQTQSLASLGFWSRRLPSSKWNQAVSTVGPPSSW